MQQKIAYQPQRVASILATPIVPISIIVAKARLASSPPLLTLLAGPGVAWCGCGVLGVSDPILPPLQGLKSSLTMNPGRCPGLSSVGLSALQFSRIREIRVLPY
jgi:hypothetical protein